MEQVYYTQCPAGYGLGSSNGAQVKRRTPGYPATGDFRHLKLAPFLPGTKALAPATLRYRRDGGIAEVAWLTPRAREFETEKGPWGKPGGHFAHALRLDPAAFAAIDSWPAGLHGAGFWVRSDPEPTGKRGPKPVAIAPDDLRIPATFAAVAPLAAGLDLPALARLLTALAEAARRNRTLFVVDEPGGLHDLIALLTFAFPPPLRADLSFSTYHDVPDLLPGFRLQGTVPSAAEDRAALAALGTVADLATGGFTPAVEPAPWAIALAGWFAAGDAAAWAAAALRAETDRAPSAPEAAWSEARLARLFGESAPSPTPRASMSPKSPAPPPPEDEPGPGDATSLDDEAERLLMEFLVPGDGEVDDAEDLFTPPPKPPEPPPKPRPVAPPPAPAPSVTKPAPAATKPAPAPAAEAKAKAKAAGTPAGIAVGIDLGTTYSVVAYLDRQGRPTSVVNSSGDILTPSVVLFEDDNVVVGKEAVAASAVEPDRVADSPKRDMGKKAYHRPINGESMPPEFISAQILRKLRADAERKLGPIPGAVITVPAYFDEPRRRATADAGKLAGIEVLDIINEPTAAALAYGHQAGYLEGPGARPLTAMVYDLGGGTFDVTIVRIEGDVFKAIATDGDVLLGGKDWDEALADILAEKLRAQFGEDPRDDPATHQDLRMAAEGAKKTLTERTRATAYVNLRTGRKKVEVTLDEFEEATAPLLGRTRATTEIVAMQAELTWAEIDKVLLVGGSTRMPMVARMLEELTGKAPDASLSADEAVAHGAALYAGLILARRGDGDDPARFTVTDVNSHSLGLIAIDSAADRRFNQVLIPKNTPLPKVVAKKFKTFKDGQKSVKVTVLEGESEQPDACTQVGECVIRGLPAGLPAGALIEVRYMYQANGRLRVQGKLLGHDAAVTTEFIRVNNLSGDDLLYWYERLAAQSKKAQG